MNVIHIRFHLDYLPTFYGLYIIEDLFDVLYDIFGNKKSFPIFDNENKMYRQSIFVMIALIISFVTHDNITIPLL